MSWKDENKLRYIDQLRFTNKKIIEMLDALLSYPGYEPIIIIQSDHGPASTVDWFSPTADMVRERMGILNAYLVPQEIRRRIYPGISPVNSFRILLRYIFGIQVKLLEDRHYFVIEGGGIRDVTEILSDVSRPDEG